MAKRPRSCARPWSTPPQVLTSAATDVCQVPAALGVVRERLSSGLVADIGGGRCDKTAAEGRRAKLRVETYDPFNREETHNARARKVLAGGRADAAVVANTLNVIREPAARAAVIATARDAVKPAGIAVFQIYEGDGRGRGRATAKGWQENRRAKSYQREIERCGFEVEETVACGGGKCLVARRAG